MTEHPDSSEPPPPSISRSRVILGASIGVLIAAGLFFASVFIGSWIDQRRNPDADLAGLAGAFAGGMVGLFLVLAASSYTTILGRRRHDGMLRGVGGGMFIALLIAALVGGLCAM